MGGAGYDPKLKRIKYRGFFLQGNRSYWMGGTAYGWLYEGDTATEVKRVIDHYEFGEPAAKGIRPDDRAFEVWSGVAGEGRKERVAGYYRATQVGTATAARLMDWMLRQAKCSQVKAEYEKKSGVVNRDAILLRGRRGNARVVGFVRVRKLEEGGHAGSLVKKRKVVR